MMKTTCFMMALIANAALVASQGNGAETQNPLVGAWHADVQPDKEKIERVLKDDGMIKPLRLLIAPKISKKLKSMVIHLEFRADGTCHIDDLNLSEGVDSQPATKPKSRTWKVVRQAGNWIQVQVTTSEANKKPTKKLWSFTFAKEGAMHGAEADWHDAPFATPRFVRVQTVTRSATTRR